MEEEKIVHTIGKNKSLKSALQEFWKHRQLLMLFAWRDLKLKYRQTILGFAWVVLQPLIMMAIFTSVFAQRIATSTSIIPYEILVFSGLIIYNVFSNGVSGASNTLVHHAHLIKKTFFPRIILPVSSVLSTAIDFLASLVILIVLMLILGPDIHFIRFIIASIIAFILAIIPTLGFGVLFSALNVRYRDINFIIPFFLMIMLFISPVIYPVGVSSNPLFQFILRINPLSGPIEIMKAGINPLYTVDTSIVLIGTTISTLIFFIGLYIFKRVQKNIADII